jgi:hypothetical protein
MLKYAEGHHEQVLGACNKSQKAPISSAMLTCTSTAPTERICIEIGMGTFHENMLRIFSLHGDLSTLLLPATLNRHKSALF